MFCRLPYRWMFYLNDCARKYRAVHCCCRQQFSCFSPLYLRPNKKQPRRIFYICTSLVDNVEQLRRGCPFVSICVYIYRHSGRTGGVPVTIGIAPPPMMMAGRSHCLRRFYHARTVTERKFHYMQMIAAEPPVSIGRCSACGAGVFRSLSITLNQSPSPS
jgi:hypothetical protein